MAAGACLSRTNTWLEGCELMSSFTVAQNSGFYLNVCIPGGPVVRTLGFHCRWHEFNPWSWN